MRGGIDVFQSTKELQGMLLGISRQSPTYQKIAIYIEKNYMQIVFMTASELAEASRVSQGSVSRFFMHLGQVSAFSKARRHRKHNPVTERNHGRLHIFIGISTFGNRIRPRQKRRLEIIVHELERNGDMRNSEFFAMKFSEGNFTVVVIASVTSWSEARASTL